MGGLALKEVIRHPLTIILIITTLGGAGFSLWQTYELSQARGSYQKCRADNAEAVNKQIYDQMKAQNKQNAQDAKVWKQHYMELVSLNSVQQKQETQADTQVSVLRKELEDAYQKAGAKNCANTRIPDSMRKRMRAILAPASVSASADSTAPHHDSISGAGSP